MLAENVGNSPTPREPVNSYSAQKQLSIQWKGGGEDSNNQTAIFTGSQSKSPDVDEDYDVHSDDESELNEWNGRYRQKFGFVFMIFASRRSTPEILAEMKWYFFILQEVAFTALPLVIFVAMAVGVKRFKVQCTMSYAATAVGTLISMSVLVIWSSL